MWTPIKEQMYRQCDAQGGLVDGVISAPDWRDPSGHFLFPPFARGADYNGIAKSTIAPNGFGLDYVAYMTEHDADYDWKTFDTSVEMKADNLQTASVANVDSFDLGPFKAAGGKLIHYNGLADPPIPAGSSVLFREKVAATMKGTTLNDFYRMVLIPGMKHCRNSDAAPWFNAGGGQTIANSTHGVPGFNDADHDVVLAVMNWKEKGVAPDSIIATKFKDDTDKDDVLNQRPICAYPSQAKYKGTGNVNLSSSWVCRTAAPIGIPQYKLGH